MLTNDKHLIKNMTLNDDILERAGRLSKDDLQRQVRDYRFSFQSRSLLAYQLDLLANIRNHSTYVFADTDAPLLVLTIKFDEMFHFNMILSNYYFWEC